MIRSKYFWIAALLLAAIPLLVMDIPKHYVDWTREVHDEMIVTVHDQYKLSKTEKANILDNILEANKTLMAGMYLKSFAAVIMLGLSIYFFSRYNKQSHGFLKPAGITFTLMLFAVAIKLYSWTAFSGNEKIKLLSLAPGDTTLTQICNNHFKGKVVYVDFWGTTCGPCLEEFRNFTPPLKAALNKRDDIAYLYISGGTELIWKQQIKKFNLEGAHLFLKQADFARLYRQAVSGNNKTTVYVPRYMIVDKAGAIADADAPHPSFKDQLISKLNTYLTHNASVQ